MMKVIIPIRLPSLNVMLIKKWRAMLSLKKKQKNATHRAFSGKRLDIPPPPLLVTITRVGSKKLDDDNLQGACKYVRDQIASEVGLDDGSDFYTWIYRQRKGDYSVEIEIEPRTW